MMRGTLRVEGELYVTLETLAEIYEVQTVWLRDAYEVGLLGAGVVSGRTVAVAVTQMERVATVVRLRHVVGPDLGALSLALEELFAT